MTLKDVIQANPNFKRLVLIGKDSRIKSIYEKNQLIHEDYQKKIKAYDYYLRHDGDLDVKVNL